MKKLTGEINHRIETTAASRAIQVSTHFTAVFHDQVELVHDSEWIKDCSSGCESSWKRFSFLCGLIYRPPFDPCFLEMAKDMRKQIVMKKKSKKDAVVASLRKQVKEMAKTDE